MEALIPKLFILTAEASIVLLLIVIAIIYFISKAKRKDIKAVNELISNYVNNKESRLSTLKNHLNTIGFSSSSDEQVEKLYAQEKTLIKEFVTLYLRHDIYRLLDYPENIMDSHDIFLKISGSDSATTATNIIDSEMSSSEENANAAIQAREQAESDEDHLKELSELRLKNTELNEHLFEALETITDLMTEHGKKTSQEVESNAQKILEAIIYLRDQRLNKNNDPSNSVPSADDTYDQIKTVMPDEDSFPLDDSSPAEDPWSVDLADNDATLDDSTKIDLGFSNELNTDLGTLDDEITVSNSAVEEPILADNEPDEAVAIQLDAPSDDDGFGNNDDPWSEALAEQAVTESEKPDDTTKESDPWADALAEQAATETEKPDDAAEESDPWADALAEQAATETKQSDDSAEESDPWADALAEQEKADKN